METWAPDVDPRSIYCSHDALNIRIQYANKLYFNTKNQVDQSLVTEFYASVSVFSVAFLVGCFCSFLWNMRKFMDTAAF